MKKSLGSFLVFGLTAVLIFGSAAASAAEQYQAEVSPEYLRSDSDDHLSTIMAGISAEVFFTPVSTADHPYAEAAFLERSASVFFSAAQENVKSDIVKGDGMF